MRPLRSNLVAKWHFLPAKLDEAVQQDQTASAFPCKKPTWEWQRRLDRGRLDQNPRCQKLLLELFAKGREPKAIMVAYPSVAPSFV